MLDLVGALGRKRPRNPLTRPVQPGRNYRLADARHPLRPAKGLSTPSIATNEPRKAAGRALVKASPCGLWLAGSGSRRALVGRDERDHSAAGQSLKAVGPQPERPD